MARNFQPKLKGGMDEEEMDPTKVLLKPDDQLELTPEELKLEHTRILSARNPHAPDNLVTFDFNKYIFAPGPNIQHMETNYKRNVSKNYWNMTWLLFI